MAFITPLFLLLGLLALPIVLLYMLRLRRREMMVSSTMLWQKLLRDREANSPWQRLRRNLLLILQLLILAALVFALARPFLPAPSIVSGNVVILLDGSASMQATDVEPTRFDAAKEQVNDLINTLSGTDQMTMILVGKTPRLLLSASADKKGLRDALNSANPEQGEADWHAAVALAAGAGQGFTNARIVVVSDGGLPDGLPPLPAETVYMPVGTSAENLAISALATRETAEGTQLFASISNYGNSLNEALLTVQIDGSLFDSRRVSVNAGKSSSLTWTLPDSANSIEASLTNISQDHLTSDNTAYAVHEGGVRNRTLIVTPGNIFLEQIYSVLPSIEPFKTSPDTALNSDDQFDLYIFDSTPIPAPIPDADILLINPPDGYATLFDTTGVFSNTATIRVADNPILQFVDWSAIHVLQAHAISAPWMQPLVESEGGPLLLIGERGGYRLAIISFDLHDSDLPLQVAFPILISNLTNWLAPGRAFDSANGLRPGDPVPLTPSATTTHIRIVSPDGTEERLEVGGKQLLYSDTTRSGLYQVQVEDNAGIRPAGAFAINLFSTSESTIMPAETIRLGIQTTASNENENNVGQWELWVWLAGVALLILLIEWWVYHRGTQLPQIKIQR